MTEKPKRTKAKPKRTKAKPKPLQWAEASVSCTPGGGWHFVIPIPERVNGIWKQGRGHTRISDKHRDDKRQAPLRFRHIAPLSGPTSALILWVRERRAGDTDSRIKATLDLLIGIAYPDDSTVSDLRIIRVDDGSEAPRVEIIVTPCEPPTMQTWRNAA